MHPGFCCYFCTFRMAHYGAPRGFCCCCCLVTQSRPTLQLHGPAFTRLLCPRNFPGKNTGVDCHFLLQGIFQGLNPCLSSLLHCRQILYHWATGKALPAGCRHASYKFTFNIFRHCCSVSMTFLLSSFIFLFISLSSACYFPPFPFLYSALCPSKTRETYSWSHSIR